MPRSLVIKSQFAVELTFCYADDCALRCGRGGEFAPSRRKTRGRHVKIERNH